jgi:hypothetical protein
VVDGLAAIAGCDGRFRLIDVASGRERASLSLGPNMAVSPAFDDQTGRAIGLLAVIIAIGIAINLVIVTQHIAIVVASVSITRAIIAIAGARRKREGGQRAQRQERAGFKGLGHGFSPWG